MYARYAENNRIKLTVDCDEALRWFFDAELIGIAVNNVIGNCIRYAKSEVRISARIEDRFLVIQVEDDGDGYPESILHSDDDYYRDVSLGSGSTGLGLYFSRTIAYSHQKSGAFGQVLIDNHSVLSGGRFRLKLP